MKAICVGVAIGLAGCGADQSPPADRTVDVGFFTAPVTVDGQLDSHLDHLSPQTFEHVFTFDYPEVDAAEISYRIGYSDTHLYVFIQTDAETVTEHRRGWLWGDGFKLILTEPEDLERSPHFYEIGYSPNSLEDYQAFNQILIAYNHTPAWRQLSEQSVSAAAPNQDGTGFEAVIAWEDVAPYNPFTSDRLGLNLYFAKAYFNDEIGQLTNGHAITPDEGIWDESLTDRSYVPLHFEAPLIEGDRALAVRTDRGRIVAGERLEAEIVAHKSGTSRADVMILNQAGGVVARASSDLSGPDGVLSRSVQLPVEDLTPGLYTAVVELDDTRASTRFAVFPDVDFVELDRDLTANARGVPEGVIHTLRFKLNQYRTALDDRPDYETASDTLAKWSEIDDLLVAFEAGVAPFAGKVEAYRRAFLSEQDGSYQPYSINLPDDYDPSRAYPLLVFLHGSAQTDEGLLDQDRGNGDFIEIAPFGRDMYEAYTASLSQRDIVEAIEDARKYFNIDPDRIVIGGFSMGGYGALRTFHENPDLYAGVAVFAGHPNLANEWLGFGHPNFLQRHHQAQFIDVPVFVYHGEDDEALDVDQIRQFVTALEDAGGDVTSSFVPGRGHRYQDDATNALYHDWLRQFERE